jgi:4-amino-4-deoxy-L-arabinose transferase-like glycosyltransferase
LLIHAAFAIDTLRQKSATVDEVGHLPAGISYWQTGTFELYHHNPPLVKLLAALPALGTGPTVDYSKSWDANRRRGMPPSPWAFGWEFMYANAARYQEIYFWARLPVVGLSLLAGVVIFWWAKELFGPGAGIVGLALWTFCPNAIAHAGMVTTDMGATSLGFVATYFFWRHLRRPSYGNAAAAGFALGLAELTKFSSLMLYLLWPGLWLVWVVVERRRRTRTQTGDGGRKAKDARTRPSDVQVPSCVEADPFRRSLRYRAASLMLVLAASVVVINVGYFFEGTFTPLGDFPFLSRSLTVPRSPASAPPNVPPDHPWASVIMQRQNRFAGTWLAHMPVPLPRHYVEGFDEQKLESEGIEGQGYPVYLRGELRRTGWWWYYFYALVVKVPVGMWLLTAVALVVAVSRTDARATVGDEIVLLAPVVLIVLAMSFFTDINLGLRYVLPIFPFWFVLLSRAGCVLATDLSGIVTRRVSEGESSPPPRSRFGLVSLAALAALAWNCVACARTHPDHLAYFNEFVGGPKNGYRHLIDSNLDWGQDLLQLESWLRKNQPGERVRLAYFGNVDPSILAASGRPIRFDLAPPARLDNLRFVAPKPGGALEARRRAWAEEHSAELQAWLIAEHARGRAVRMSDHPTLRAMAIESIGADDGPRPGLFAISANFVAGLPFRLRDQDGNLWNAEQDAYGYFRDLIPVHVVGGSIFIFDVTADQANVLRATLSLPPVATRPTPPQSDL